MLLIAETKSFMIRRIMWIYSSRESNPGPKYSPSLYHHGNKTNNQKFIEEFLAVVRGATPSYLSEKADEL